jgi:hypothetical protein
MPKIEEEGGGQEAELESKVVADFLDRLLRSIDAIHFRSLADTEDEKVFVDLTASGFPNAHEIRRLVVDQGEASARLKTLETGKNLRTRLVDQLIRTQKDPLETLAKLGERAYVERLNGAGDLFLLCTPGSFTRLGSENGMRKYAYAWGCYDSDTNRPYLHILTFDQDTSQDPLEERSLYRDRFLEIVHSEGSRSNRLYPMILAIDNALDGIHPKIIKRICLGPFFSEHVFGGRDQSKLSREEEVVQALLMTGSPEDFVLCGSEEIIVSKGEDRLAKGILANLGLRKSVRQIFLVHDAALGIMGTGVSHAHRFTLLPHSIAQQLPALREGLPPELRDDVTIYPYGEKGVLYV